MFSLLKSSLKTSFARKETYIFLAFSLFPLMIILVSLFKTNFMQLSATKGSMDCITFFEAMTYSQFQLTLPLIVIIYLAATSVHDEIKEGIVYIYKDISRDKVINSKILSLLLIYALYVGLTFVFSVITYYVNIIRMPYASKTFLPTTTSNLVYALFTIIAVVLTVILIIVLSVALATKFNNGVTILVSVIFTLVNFITPQLQLIKYIFQISYANFYEKMGSVNALLIMLVLFAIYAFVFSYLAHYWFKRVEY